MNIADLNSKLYGHKNLKQGEYADFIMDSFEQEEIKKLNFYNKDGEINKFDRIDKKIKF